MFRGEGLGNLLVLREILITYAAFHPGKSPRAYWCLFRKTGSCVSKEAKSLCTIWFRGQLCPRNERPVQPVPGGPGLWGGHLLEFLLLHGEILQRLQGRRSAQKNRWGDWEQIRSCAVQRPLVVKQGTGFSSFCCENICKRVWCIEYTLNELKGLHVPFRVGGSPVEGIGPSALYTSSHRWHGKLCLLPQVYPNLYTFRYIKYTHWSCDWMCCPHLRWLLLGFQREFEHHDALRLFEVLSCDHLELISQKVERARYQERLAEKWSKGETQNH